MTVVGAVLLVWGLATWPSIEGGDMDRLCEDWQQAEVLTERYRTCSQRAGAVAKTGIGAITTLAGAVVIYLARLDGPR